MNFSDFDKNSTPDVNEIKSNVDKEKIEDLLDKYSTFSERELLDEFLKVSLDEKKKGNLSEDNLNNLRDTLDPYLDDNAKGRLDEILKRL